jgi:hypothetical protein
MPEDGEAAGLLALMLLTRARRTARVSASGELVTLDEQDRGAWDAALIAEGHQLVRERLAARVVPGRHQILAAISAVHTSARDARDTGWPQVVALYDQLVHLDPSPVIALNRAIAVAELDGPEVALAAVDRLEPRLAGYHAYHAGRADLGPRRLPPNPGPGAGTDRDARSTSPARIASSTNQDDTGQDDRLHPDAECDVAHPPTWGVPEAAVRRVRKRVSCRYRASSRHGGTSAARPPRPVRSSPMARPDYDLRSMRWYPDRWYRGREWRGPLHARQRTSRRSVRAQPSVRGRTIHSAVDVAIWAPWPLHSPLSTQP